MSRFHWGGAAENDIYRLEFFTGTNLDGVSASAIRGKMNSDRAVGRSIFFTGAGIFGPNIPGWIESFWFSMNLFSRRGGMQ